jgi:2-amino-4-hydroxy-6-hydroxymethyldihydropteridine diphosphokinase
VTQIYVSIGSNKQPHKHVAMALDAINAFFSPVELSPIYESVAVGFVGDNFFNLIAGFDTGLSLTELDKKLSQIEQDCGRKRSEERFTSRTMDLDLLVYGDLVRHDDHWDLPRGEITRNAFVLKPLAELAPDFVHPELGLSFLQLWQQGDFSGQDLWKVEI